MANTDFHFTKKQLVAEILCITILIATFAYITINWQSIPEEIPRHYGADGQPDSWGGRNSILLLPFIGLGAYILITVCSFFPKFWNMPVEITAENREGLMIIARDMLGSIKLIMLAAFFMITVWNAAAAAIPMWFMPLFLVLLFGSIIYYLIIMFRFNKKIYKKQV